MGAAGRRSRATMPVSRSRPVLRRAFERRAALGVGDEEASPRWAGCSGRSIWTIWAASGRRRRARAPNRTLTVHILTGNAPAAGRCQARRLWRVGSSPAGMGSSSTYDRRSRRSTSGSCRPKSGETTRLKCAKSATPPPPRHARKLPYLGITAAFWGSDPTPQPKPASCRPPPLAAPRNPVRGSAFS